jgi:DDE_Tnp_1-associated
MSDSVCLSLLDAMQRLTDPRHRRGVRHPYSSLLGLTLLGLLCRQSDFTAIARWAKQHWAQLRAPLGFTRKYAPHGTTLGRACARYRASEFAAALLDWLRTLLDPEIPLTAAVDGKTSKQAHDADGDPLHILNVFAHDLKVCLAQWPVGDGKDTEPEVLKAHLDELFDTYPALQLLTGDAIFTQRPLARLITERGKHYLTTIKDNQPDLLEAARTAFHPETPATADATCREKKGGAWCSAACGSIRRRRTTPGSSWTTPGCGCWRGWTARCARPGEC